MADKITVHLQIETAKCPVCGKMFTPAPEHALKIGEAFSSKKGLLLFLYAKMGERKLYYA